MHRSARFAGPALLALAACGGADPVPPPPGQGANAGSAPGGASATEAAAAGLRFREVGADWGLDFVHENGVTEERHLPETMGGGALILDADGDGDQDLYFVQSGPVPVGAARVRTPDMPPNRLYENLGPGRFADATAESGAGADRGYGQGAAAGDVDGDGDPDVYVTNVGPDVLLRNDGSGRFDDVTAAAGIDDPRWTAGATFFDADADGDLDLWVTGYVLVDLEHPERCGAAQPGWRTYCHPDRYPGQEDRFWRNLGDGRFEDQSARAGIAGAIGKGLGAVAGDYDEDGDLDVYVAHDSVENKLWRNRGDAVFEDATLLSGTGVDGGGQTEAGMGLASGDFDGDLDLDLIVTNFDDESDTLYENQGGMLFADVTAEAGLEAPSRLPVGFGVVMEDLDLDGDLDLAVANGHILHNIHLYNDAQTHAQRANLFENTGRGRYRLAAPGPQGSGDFGREPQVGRGLYAGDLDGDGRPDLLAVECGGPARIYRNESGGSSLALDGLPRGTLVRIRTSSGRTVLREAAPQPSYYGQSEETLRVGLAAGERAEALELRLVGGERAQLELGAQGGPGRLWLRREGAVWRAGPR